MGEVKEMIYVSCLWVLQRRHCGGECNFTSTLCKHGLKKGDLFVVSWARVQRVRREVSLQCC